MNCFNENMSSTQTSNKKKGTMGKRMGLLHSYKTMIDLNGDVQLINNSQVLDKLLENWGLDLHQARLRTSTGECLKINLKDSVNQEKQQKKLIEALKNGCWFASYPKNHYSVHS